ncbi:MAG: hypothetical protein IJK78_05155 [Bacteroidales bacterium]|nr:hypothetical protein [Bacteroidales bacterium]
MEKFGKYNELLNTLFDLWEKSYDENDREKFCRDGLMLKFNDSINVDELWEKSPRRILFLLKDNPDGKHDTRLWLIDNNNGNKNRNLKTQFIKKIAQAFFGLIYCKYDNTGRINNNVVNSHDMIDVVKKTWNELPFAFVEAKKVAGGKTVSESQLKKALQRDAVFINEEFGILRPNVIVCCDSTGDALFDFVTTEFLNSKEKPQEYGGNYILENGYVVPNLKTHLRYYTSNKTVVIKSYHPSARVGWKFLEKIFSPYRAFIRDHPDF